MKTITKQQLAQLNKMNKGSFVLDKTGIQKCENESESFLKLKEAIDYLPKRKSAFERFYDNVGKFLFGNKPFAWGELKSL